MSISHILDNGVCPPPWISIRAHRLHSCTDLQFDRDLIGEIRLNGNIPPGAPRTFLHTNDVNVINWKTFNKEDIPAGNDGDYLQTIAGTVEWAPPTFDPSVLAPGTAYQLLQTNSTATAAEWTSNITIPQNLSVQGSTLLQSNVNCDQTFTVDGLFSAVSDAIFQGNTDIEGDLLFNSNSGTAGQFIKKTGVSTQDWNNIVAADVTSGANGTVLTSVAGVTQWVAPSVSSSCIYSTTFTAQNINNAVGPAALLFSTIPYANQVTGSAIAITQPSATQFTIGTTNLYSVMINGFIDPTSTGLGNSIVSLSLEVNGVELQTSCVVCNGNYSFTGSFSSVSINAGENVRVLARRIVGTNTLNTFASGSAIPSFASTISFRF